PQLDARGGQRQLRADGREVRLAVVRDVAGRVDRTQPGAVVDPAGGGNATVDGHALAQVHVPVAGVAQDARLDLEGAQLRLEEELEPVARHLAEEVQARLQRHDL